MPTGLIVKYPKFNRQPDRYKALLMRRQRADGEHGKWEPVSRWGFVVLAPNEHELREMARFLGPRVGFPPPWGVIDDAYEQWLWRHHFKKLNYGRPTGEREMLYAELIRGWIPSEEALISGRASPGITDGEMEPRDTMSTDETIAMAVASSMAQ